MKSQFKCWLNPIPWIVVGNKIWIKIDLSEFFLNLEIDFKTSCVDSYQPWSTVDSLELALALSINSFIKLL